MLLPAIKKLSNRLRFDVLSMTTTAGSGHPTSSLSAVELMAMLYFKYLRLDTDNPKNLSNDRVIFSKGHASPLLYALFHVAGIISDKELGDYRQFGSVLEGHPTPRFPFADIATGSLGQGLAIGLGEALAGAPRVFVLLGDGELSEGAIWEAVMAAGYHKTQNLIALADINALEQSGGTMDAWDTEAYRKRFEAFGWAAIVVDGHDLKMLDTAYQKAIDYRGGPTIILAKTNKGHGISFLQNKHGWHGKVLSKELLVKALAELGDVDTSFEGIIKKPESTKEHAMTRRDDAFVRKNTVYEKPTTTREGFGKALVRLGTRDTHMMVLDGDLEKSTYTQLFHEAFPKQFFECHIAEQLMVGIAAGMAICGKYPVISSYGSFLTRAFDQLRMAALSGMSLMVNGSHGGVSVGPDGASQMGLEDIALFRTLPNSIVLSPADAVSAEKLTECIYGYDGIAYIRTTRPNLPILYDGKTEFAIGGSHVFTETNMHRAGNKTGSSTKPVTSLPTKSKLSFEKIVTIIATGVTVHEALKAQKELEASGTPTRVIDCYSIKPIDAQAIRNAAAVSKQLIIVEDHYPEGGLGEAVFTALSGTNSERVRPSQGQTLQMNSTHLAVYKQPMSGTAEELLRYEEIDATAIIRNAIV